MLQGRHILVLHRRELEAIREHQRREGKPRLLGPGQSGDRPFEDIENALKADRPWVLRLLEWQASKTSMFYDLIKGEIDITENEIDIVLLKSDGIPTYHFAHVVDDHHADNPCHPCRRVIACAGPYSAFQALGSPEYAHIGPIMIMDGSSKRKISKRKDPQFGLIYYKKSGYPVEAVYEYVLTILNSNFEDWRRANPDAPAEKFPFSLRKMNPAGSLFDAAKLSDISKNVVSKMTADKIYADLLEWAKEFEPPFATALSADPEYAKAIISIGRGGKKPRKDYGTWAELREYMRLFYYDTFTIVDKYPEGADKDDIKATLKRFLETYDPADEQGVWFAKIKSIASSLGYAAEMKEYKANPGAWRGSVADISMFLRVALTGKLSSPDMYAVMQILGKTRVRQRLEAMLSRLG